MGNPLSIVGGDGSGRSPERRPPRPVPSLGRHQLVLAVVLFALIPVAGLDAVWSADEGALLYQIDAVVAGRGWTFPHPFPTADPSGTWFPIHLASWAADAGSGRLGPSDDCRSTVDGCRYIVLAKHAGYLQVTAGLYRLGGYGALIVASVASTVAAAAATARLAAMADRTAAVPALWIAGLASPLFMASYVAWGHTAAAALVGWAAVLLLGADRSVAGRGAGLALLFLACLVRTEAPMAGLAIGFALMAISVLESRPLSPFGRWRPTIADAGLAANAGTASATTAGSDLALVPAAATSARQEPAPSGFLDPAVARTGGMIDAPEGRGGGLEGGARVPTGAQQRQMTDRRGLCTGAAAVVVAVVGVVVDRLTDIPTGGPVEPVGFDEAFGFLAGRIEAFTITWLQPAYGSDPRELLILAAAAMTLVAGVLARRGPTATTATTAALAVAVLALMARFAVAPGALVPGLVTAFPVLFAGLLLLDRRTIVVDRVLVLLISFSLFCGAVLATQYRHGGGGEWGGRYFMVGLPLGIAAATVGLVRAGARLPRPDRRSLGALLALSMALLSMMGLLGLRAVRHQTADLAVEVDRALAAIEQTGDEPVVVTTIHGLGRWMWQDVDRGRWLRVPDGELPTAGRRLRSLGVETLVLVSAEPARQVDLIAGSYRPDVASRSRSAEGTAQPAGGGIVVLTMEQAP